MQVIDNPDDPYYILHRIVNEWNKTKIVYAKDEYGEMHKGTIADHELEWLVAKVKKAIDFSISVKK